MPSPSLPPISPHAAFERVQDGTARLIDIRDTDEYAALSIPGAQLIPLSIIDRHPLDEPCVAAGNAGLASKSLIFFCHAGSRTQQAAPLLEQLVVQLPDNGRAQPRACALEGGIAAWEQAGLPVQRGHVSFPLFRQIQIAAGSLILVGVVGSAVWHPMFWLTALVGAGLVMAGVTGFCGMGLLLARMPWNTRR